MSLGAEAWWFAMLGADQFEDGSLVIEDDTLDVNGGSTVNLRVKLGARPRSDVTVALSEASDLISLGTASLTFTRDNWDTYQSVVVTGAGNSQTLDLPADAYGAGASSKGWTLAPNRPQVIAALLAASPGYLSSVIVFNTGNRVQVRLNPTVAGSEDDFAREDLSNDVETNGSITLTAAGQSVSTALASTDTEEPYTLSGVTGANAMFTALSGTADTEAGTLRIRDYTLPADPTATISLSASGTPEYDGKTDSATVTVD